jgi:DNA-binding ferritin-like protein (Dps family)
MSHLISELKKQPIGKSKKEINRLRKIRGTLAHSYELNNKEMKEYLWSIRYIDNILQLIVKNEISALNLEK